MHHFDQKPIISEVIQMEWCVPFDFPTGISGFSTQMVSTQDYQKYGVSMYFNHENCNKSY